MKFDHEIQKENGALNYGVVEGNEKIVLIKAGAGGSHHQFKGHTEELIKLCELI